MIGKLYGIGVGPGDPELITLKGIKAIENSHVIVSPSALKDGDSIALETVKPYITQDKHVEVLHFPMGKADRKQKVYMAYKTIEKYLIQGKNVSFLTIGDPFVYSTYIYLLEYFRGKGYDIETIPGITSFCASASLSGIPLVIGDNNLLILPGSKYKEIKDQPYVVIMKVYKKEKEIVDHLDKLGYTYTYISRAGRDGEVILTNKEEIEKSRDYMSLIIASKTHKYNGRD